MLILLLLLNIIHYTFQSSYLASDYNRVVVTKIWNSQNNVNGVLSALMPLGITHFIYERDLTNIYYFISSASNNTNSELFYLHYLEISVKLEKIIHHVLFWYEDQWSQFEFEFDKFNYEGQQFYQYVYFDTGQHQIVVGLKQQSNFGQQEYRIPYLTKNNFNYSIVFGGQFYDYHPISKEAVKYKVFPGKITGSIDDSVRLDINLLKITCSASPMKQLDQIQFTESNQYQQFFISKQNMYYYQVQFWAKVGQDYDTYLNQNIHMIRIAANRFTTDFTATGSNSFVLDYNYDYQQQQWLMNLRYSSYNLPIIIQFENGIDGSEYQDIINIDDFKLISQWHFITITYTATTLIFAFKSIIENFELQKTYLDVHQFSFIYYRLLFGGQMNSQNTMERSFALILFYDCENTLSLICHYSCLTCYGPLANQCQSCDLNSNRNYDEKENTCLCKLWYTEQQNQVCQLANYTNAYLDLVDNVNIDESVCKFGYFNFENECFKCPSASQSHQVACTECLRRPKDWVYKKSSCILIYSQDQSIQTFLKLHLDETKSTMQFIFQDGDLRPCQGCLLCEDSQQPDCFLSKYQHLNSPTYIKCHLGYERNEGECKPSIILTSISNCPNNCDKCDSSRCLSCIDQQKYFLDLSGHCQRCSIQNCKFCFQYNKHNPIINSIYIVGYDDSGQQDDFQIGCALCEDKYYFSFRLNQCLRDQSVDQCYYLENYSGQLECYSTQLEQQTSIYQQIYNCEDYMPNCSKCARNYIEILMCIQCDNGYYINSKNGLCEACSNIFSNKTINCYSESKDKSSFRLPLVGFVQYFNQQYFDFDRLVKQFDRIEIGSCINGEVLDSQNNKCMQGCANCKTCALINKYSQCLQCDAPVSLVNFYSQEDGQCFSCPYACKFCLPQDLDQIYEYNPYFLVSDLTVSQTYKCLKNFDDTLTYIDSKSGLIKPLKDFTIPQSFMLTLNQSSSTTQFKNISNLQSLIQKSVQYYNYSAILISYVELQLMSKVFSLNNSTLQIVKNGYYNDLNTNQSIVYLNNWTTVVFLNYNFSQQNFLYDIISTYGVKIILISNIISNPQNTNKMVSFSNVISFEISQLIVENTVFDNSQAMMIKSFYNTSEIYIHRLSFKNCIFNNSAFFTVMLENQNRYIIKNITLINCTFIQSFLITQDFNSINYHYTVTDLNISNCSFVDSSLIFISQTYLNIEIKNIFVSQSQFYNSTIIQSSSSSSLINCRTTFLSLRNSVLFKFKLLVSQQFLEVVNLQGDNLSLQSSIIISINSQSKQNVNLCEITNIIFENIEQFQPQTNDIDGQLIFISDANVKVTNVVIKTRGRISLINLKNCYTIVLNQFSFLQVGKFDSISQLTNEFGSFQHSSIIIENFQELTITNIALSNLIQILDPLISVRSEYFDSNLVKIERITLDSILNVNLVKYTLAIINVQIDSQCQISILNSKFINNRFFYNISNLDIMTSSLIQIKAPQSNIYLKNVEFNNNSNFNSSEAQLYLTGNTIWLQNFQANLTTTNVSQFIQQCGFIVLGGQDINIINSTFLNINSRIFYVFLEFDGNLVIRNNTFSNSVIQDNSDTTGGVITVDASLSTATIDMFQIFVKNIISRLSGAFLNILPSQVKNDISIGNIQLINVYSVDGSFAQLNFFSTSQYNMVRVYNVYVDNSDMNLYNQISNYDFMKTLNSNQLLGYITSSYSNITISNFTYVGLVTQPILKLFLNRKALLYNVNLINLSLRFSFAHLLYIENSYTRITNLIISNVTGGEVVTNFISFNLIKQFDFFVIDTIRLQNIQCPFCQNGLINFINQSEISQTIKCMNLIYHDNDCGINSCFVSANTKLTLVSSYFTLNTVISYGIINIVSGYAKLLQVIFKNNRVQGSGGAIYLGDGQISFSHVIVVNNTAEIGGGIYSKNNQLKKDQVVQIYLKENIGLKGFNNIREQPDFLQLQMYGVQLKNNRTIIKEFTIDTPLYIVNFQKFKLNEQFVMTSSGQSVKESKIFNSTTMEYMKTNISLQIQQFTQLGELVTDTFSSSCKIQQLLMNETLNYSFFQTTYSNKKNNSTTLNFNNTSFSFILNDLIFYLDPYLNSSYYLLIDSICDSIQNKNYHFYFNVRTTKCGIGEYYNDSQCLQCDYDKGYYSLEKNSLECERVDPKKIKQVISSSLQLYSGFWRLNYFSSQIDQCLSHSSLCLGGWDVNYNSCVIGAIGALCEECDIYNIRGGQQFIKLIEGKCQQKEITGEAMVELFFLMFILFVITCFISLISREMHLQYLRLKSQSIYYKILSKFNNDQIIPIIKQTIYIMQILYAIFPETKILDSDYSQIIWPVGNPSKIILLFIELFVDIFTISIIYTKAVGSILIPMVQILIIFIIFATYQRTNQQRKTLLVNIYTSSLFLLFYSMPNIIEQQKISFIFRLSMLISKRNIVGLDWISSNVSYRFDTDEHKQWISYFILPALIIFIILLPLILFNILYKERKNQADPTKGLQGFLIADYQEKYYFWELVNLEVVLIVLFFHSNLNSISIIFSDLFIIAVLFIYYASISYFKPFIRRGLNHLEKVGIIFVCLLASFSCLLQQVQLDNLEWVQYLISILIVIMLLGILIYLCLNIMIAFYYKYNEDLDCIRYRIKSYFPNIEIQCPQFKHILQLRKETKAKIYQRFQFAKFQLKMSRQQGSKIHGGAMNLNNEDNGIILSNILRTENRHRIMSMPLQQSILM